MSSAQAKAYHSVNFGDKNTWDDWRLIPLERPSIAPPDPIIKDEEIPALNGKLDRTEELTGTVQYGKASGTLSFLIMNPEIPGGVNSRYWVDIRNDILNYLHGRRMRMILDDQPNYYYEGRFSVQFAPGPQFSGMTVSYIIDKYRKHI